MNGKEQLFVAVVLAVVLTVLEGGLAGDVRAWGKFAEPGFPYLARTVDARAVSGGAIADNLVVRGVILFLGGDTYACFDTDLARLALVWKGGFLDDKSMAAHSYSHLGEKNHGGQSWVCRPLGRAISASGLYPGGFGEQLDVRDPRAPGPDLRELGRGPMAPSLGQWESVCVAGERAVVEYSLRGTSIRESLAAVDCEEGRAYIRSLSVAPHQGVLQIVLGESLGEVLRARSCRKLQSLLGEDSLRFEILFGDPAATLVIGKRGVVVLRLLPSAIQREFRVLVARGVGEDFEVGREEWTGAGIPDAANGAGRHWPEAVVTKGRLGEGDGYVVDELTLPLDNPWKRQVRSADMAFLPDRSAVVVTFDGDVWRVWNLDESLEVLKWRRIASGLHEPQSIHFKDGKLFVYTRSGLMRLHDLNGDGEVDRYETFSNRFTQTAETREFPNDAAVTKDGGFLLAKPGQQAAHQGLDNGSILKVSPDGKTVRRIATGFRQPYLGYRAGTGLITASDQQGHWVPTTPIYWVREERFYGFRPSAEVAPPDLPATAPICWIPHRVVQSATAQVWLDSEKFGPLSGRLVCLDYYRSNIVLVHLDDAERPVQGAVSPWPLPLDLPLLKGDINPHDGWLYLTGFRIWGSKAKPWSGIRRVRYRGGAVDFPTTVRAVREGLILGFESPLQPESARNPANYHVGRWNYRRTKKYGSGHYKTNGKPGADVVSVGGVALSRDGRSVLIVIPDMKPVMQMETVYRLQSAEGRLRAGAAYATVHELRDGDLADAGFSQAEVDAFLQQKTAGRKAAKADATVSAIRGRQVYQTVGCMACHSLDGSTAGRSGPTLRGVFGKRREFAKGVPRRANAAYIRDAILHPSKNVLKMFADSDIGMPSYQGVLTEPQTESLIAFIKSLRE